MPTVSLYLSDDILKQIDQAVEIQAQRDRQNGLSGRAITTRSSYIEKILSESLNARNSLTIEDIEYHVISLAEEYGAKKVSLFGSYARGEERPDSDIDILLDKGSIKGMKVLEFQDELARRLDKDVDVVTTAGASPRFLKHAQNDEVVLYEAG